MKDLSKRVDALSAEKARASDQEAANQAEERTFRVPEIERGIPSTPPVATFDVVILAVGLRSKRWPGRLSALAPRPLFWLLSSAAIQFRNSTPAHRAQAA